MWTDTPYFDGYNRCTVCTIGSVLPCSFMSKDPLMRKFSGTANIPLEACNICKHRFRCWTS